MKHLLLAIATIAATAMSSCGNSSQIAGSKATDSTLCQFSNIDNQRLMQYVEEGDTFYIDNEFKAFWPQLINGKPCPNLQQAILMELTDSAELNTIELAMNYLLKPDLYLEIDSTTLTPVKTIPETDGKLSSSEFTIKLEDMTDRLMTYHIATYGYLTGAAHGIYSNRYVTYDLKREKAVSMSDVIADTTILRTAILASIKQTYQYDKDDLFIPENGLLPLPTNFLIDGSVFHAVYQVYDIASYAQGAIDAPIYPYTLKPEEMKRLFTPYGLELINYSE